MIKNYGGGRAPWLGLVAAALGAWGCAARREPRRYQGVIEMEERDLAFEVPGRLSEVRVREGDVLAPGAVIARLDDRLARAALAVRENEARVAGEQSSLVRSGARGEDIRALEARVAAAAAAAALAARTAERTRHLGEAQAVPAVAVDEAETALRRAQNEHRALEENLRALAKGARAQEVEAAMFRRSAAEAAVALERERLDRHELRADQAGEVLEVHFEPGEMTSPGLPVATIADVSRPYAEVFVPQSRLAGLRQGQPAWARVDGVPDEVPGRIELVHRRTEFTPHYLFSEGERENLVVRVKVRFTDPGRRLHAGVPVFVRIDGAATAPAPDAGGGS
jgi:HlyD family secretion protein